MAMAENQIRVFKSLKETRKPEVAKIIGEIPEWAAGQVSRSCPAKWDYPKFRLNHTFDGYQMITKFDIKGGKSGSVSFTSKFVSSEAFKRAEASQKPIISEFSTRTAGSDAKSALGKIVAMILQATDNCQYICTSEICRNPIVIGHAGFMYELDPKSLHCISKYDSANDFSLHAISAHPLTDPATGETYNVGISIVPAVKWKVVKYPQGCKSSPLKETLKKGKIIGSHSCRTKSGVPLLHSFGMSNNYLVWIDQPCHFNLAKAIKLMFKGFCQREVMDWFPEKKNQFYIFNKKTLKVMKTEILSKDAFVFLHILNCYEENDHLIVDLFGMPNIQFVDAQVLAKLRAWHVLRDAECPRLLRFVIPLGVATIGICPENKNLVSVNSTATALKIDDKIFLQPELVSDVKMDFPTWNKKFSGKDLRFVWTTGALCPSVHHHKVIKLKTIWFGKLFGNEGEMAGFYGMAGWEGFERGRKGLF